MKKDQDILKDMPISLFMDEVKACVDAVEHYIDCINTLYLVAKEEENTTAINALVNYEKVFYDKYNKGLLK